MPLVGARRRSGSSSPALSVVMAAHNAARYLPEAIDSVLAQSMEDFELLIVDDASTDDSPDILAACGARDPRIRIFTNERTLGPFRSANLAIRQARGTYIARQDADDVSYPERFAVQLEALASHPDVSLVSGPLEVFDGETGRQTRIHHPRAWQPRLEWDLLFTNAGGTSANVMFPRVFRGVPILYPGRHRYAEDYWLWCTLSRLGRVVSPPNVLYRYREHGLSITSRRRSEQDECAVQIRRAYASQHFRPDLGEETVDEVLRFWTRDASLPFFQTIHGISGLLAELRSTFLAYVERRYGRRDRALLEGQLERAFNERLSFWLCRSLRFLDAGACRELFSIACARGTAARVSGRAVGQLVAAAVKKAGPIRPDARI